MSKLNLLPKLLSVFVLIPFQTAKAQTIGNWNTSSAQTTTASAVGIGTNTPDAWEEIEYCQNTQSGLIVTKDNSCNSGGAPGGLIFGMSSGNLWDNSQLSMMAINLDENYAKAIPVSFEYVPVLSNPSRPYSGGAVIGFPMYSGGQPLIWAREGDPNTPGSYGTRFIVTPDGRVGINMPSPRAPLDVRGSYDVNVPIAIFGINSNNFTRHLHLVANLGNGAYNRISRAGDYGLFFTDGQGTGNDGSNNSGALVIAPWSNQPNPSGIRIDANGNVGIGAPMVNNPNGYKLGVNGLIICKELVVDIEDAVWPDYVFDSTYNLQSLDSLRDYITRNKHLTQVSSADDMSTCGEMKVSEMQILLLRKIEELTLYILQLDERNKRLEAKLNDK